MLSLFKYFLKNELFIVLILTIHFNVKSQIDTALTILTFELGEVKITAGGKNSGTNELSQDEIQQFNQNNAAAALQLIPGLTYLNSGARNESIVNIRGFDLRQVPVYLDGVPVYVTYDGYADLGNFLVQDIAKISVSKGVSSILFGPNTLGGAINLVTRKPEKIFELDGSTGFYAGSDRLNGWHSEMHAGSKFNKFYVQAGYSIIDRESYSLSKKYEFPYYTDNQILDNSYRKDMKWNVKAGIVPNTTDEYALSFMSQNGSKGVPVYAGADTNMPIRYWQFPEVYNRGVNLISKTALGQAGYLKTRFYYDQYYSDLRSYDSSDYSFQTKKSSFTSIYFDESIGGSAEYHMDIAAKHNLKAAVHYKYDHHREHNTWPVDEEVRHMKDQFISAGVEENYTPAKNLLIIGGISYNFRDNLQADNYDSGSDSVFPFPANRDAALNAQLGLDYHIAKSQDVRLSLARKTRFATMKDRYSYRLGRSLPNPDLTSESAFHIDLSHSASAGIFFKSDISVFCSLLNHTIQSVYGVDPDNPSVYQMQNTGKAVFYGLETDIGFMPVHSLVL